MRKLIFTVLAILICATGCQEEIESPYMDSLDSFYAVTEQPGNTKTYLDENFNVRFQKGDQIAVFNNSTASSKYEIDPADDGKTQGTFNKVVQQSDGSIQVGSHTNAIVAYYPYTKLELDATSAQNGTYELKGVTVPAVQNYDATHIVAQNTLPMLSAKTDNDNVISFKNICGVLKLSILGNTNTRIKQISFKGNNQEVISGNATVSVKPNENPMIAMDETASTVVVLDCGETGVALDPETPKSFMFVLPPMIFEKGFEITITDTEGGSKVKKTTLPQEIRRSLILNMKEPIIYGTLVEPDPTFITIDANGTKFKMIKVEGGTFTMGATPEQEADAFDNEKPVHQVTLSDYYIGEMEVTNQLWEAVMRTNQALNGNQRPYETIQWDEILSDFLPKLNELTGMTFALPTEAQWEYAARGGNKSKGYKYSGSNNIDDVAWYKSNTRFETKPVGQKLPNELGLYDMSGNIREYCIDWYRYYTSQSQIDPIGPISGSNLVTRGGHYNEEATGCRVSCRHAINNNNPEKNGFRLVLSNISSMNKTSLKLVPGASETMIPVSNGHSSINKEFSWTSSNPNIASVDSYGKVTAHGVGNTVITARINDTGKEVSSDIEVVEGICVKVNDIELPLVKVKGGSFIMGATPEQLENDGTSPGAGIAHKVTLSDYYIGQFEVTQELWAAVMGSYPSGHLGNVKYPVEKVSWDTIVNEFLPELNTMTGKNFTLPTEAQWEYAARGGNKSKKYKYSGSNDLAEVGWYNGNHYYHCFTRVGGLLKPNELGIYDMSGNVYEWCNDGWEYYTASPQINPTGPTNSSERCFRGGYYYSDAKDCTVSTRSKQYPSSSDSKVGFRLALSL